MEWYYWVLMFYVYYVFMSVMIAISLSKNYDFFKKILLFIVAMLFGLVVAPFLWLASLVWWFLYKTPSYKTFTIHELTDDNKITLRQLGFREGDWVSNNNIRYYGFRFNGGDIAVQNDGNVFAKYIYFLSKEQKHLIKQIKNLPNNTEKKED